jgi:hypothetical protein
MRGPEVLTATSAKASVERAHADAELWRPA